MVKESSGIIDDTRTYTSQQIATILGRAERWAKEFIRDNVPFADLGNGLLMVSGKNWRLAIEKTLPANLPEAKKGDARINWDHPVVKSGIVPGYLVKELFGYTDSTWRKKRRELSSVCGKTMNGETWFSLPALCSYLGSPGQAGDEDE